MQFHRILFVLWLLCVFAGFLIVERHERTPGPTTADGPGAATPSPGKMTMTLYLHPHCPCSKASLAVLQSIQEEHSDHLDVNLVVVRPRGVEPGWEEGKILQELRHEKWNLRLDEGGEEARKSGATTSGHTRLVSPTGTVLFEGGLTEARGQYGGLIPRKILLRFIKGESHDLVRLPVYGCALE